MHQWIQGLFQRSIIFPPTMRLVALAVCAGMFCSQRALATPDTGLLFLQLCDHKTCRVCSHLGRNGFLPYEKGSCSITQLFSRPKVSKSHCVISQEPKQSQGSFSLQPKQKESTRCLNTVPNGKRKTFTWNIRLGVSVRKLVLKSDQRTQNIHPPRITPPLRTNSLLAAQQTWLVKIESAPSGGSADVS